MDFNKACCILEINNDFDENELKKAFRIKALKWHPDKNINNEQESKKKFQEICAAHKFLLENSEFKNININFETNNYYNILNEFINNIFNSSEKVVKNVINSISNKLINNFKLIEQLDNNSLTKLYDFIYKYEDILFIDKQYMDQIKKNIKDLIQNRSNNIIIINPTLKNILSNDIYVLNYNNNLYYIPLWHSELIYEINNNNNNNNNNNKNINNIDYNENEILQVKCIPELNNNIKIDKNNNIIYNLKLNISELLNENTYVFNIGPKVIELNINELKIKKYQKYVIYKQGISKININDIYNVTSKSNIIIYIEFI